MLDSFKVQILHLERIIALGLQRERLNTLIISFLTNLDSRCRICTCMDNGLAFQLEVQILHF